MEHEQTHREHLDLTAALWRYRLDGDQLVVEGRRAPEERDSWRQADRERPLYLRLADLSKDGGGRTAVLRRDWRDHALAFANLYGPPVPTRRLALARTVALSWFSEESLVLQWAIRLRSSLSPGEGRSRVEAAKAAIQIRSLVPSLPDDTFLVHSRRSHGMGETGDAEGDRSATAWRRKTAVPLSKDEVERGLRDVSSRRGQDALWEVSMNVFASLLNIRLEGVTPVCLPGATRSGLPQLGFGFRFPAPLARIWYGLWEDAVGIDTAECERCGRAFIVTRANQRFCTNNCRTAAGVERHRKRKRDVRAR